MGVFKGYQIEWINALTGGIIDTTEKISDIYGHLKLVFPGTLTGNATCPIMFFKLYRTDATFLAPIPSNESETNLPQDFVKDENTTPIEPTDWNLSSKEDFQVLLSPNPTDGLVSVSLVGDIQETYNWQLMDGNGRVILEGNTLSSNFTLDLSVYATGVYYLLVNSQTNEVQTKIVKI